MNISVVATVARQINGDMVQIRLDKAFQEAQKADEHVKQAAKSTVETLDTPYGPIQFYCERSVFHGVEVV